jgi:hypothetical protein
MTGDHSDIYEIEKRLKLTIKRLRELAPLVGQAKQVRDYDSDRRKNLLARYTVPLLKAGKGVASSESHARADPAYNAELDALAGQRGDAEQLIAQWEAAFADYESKRSLLSMAKETIKTIE